MKTLIFLLSVITLAWPDGTAADPGRTLTVIMAGGKIGSNSYGGGATYYRYDDKPGGGWIVPLTYSLDVVSVVNASRDLKGTFALFGLSISGIKRKKGSSSCFLVEGTIPFGTESVDNGPSHFFIGIASHQGFMLLPASGAGFALSIGPYESYIFNSELYPWDAGLKVRIGAQF